MPKHPEKQPVKELCTFAHYAHTHFEVRQMDRQSGLTFLEYIFIHLKAKALRHQYESFIHLWKMKVILFSVFGDDVWLSILPSCNTKSYLQEVHFHCAHFHSINHHISHRKLSNRSSKRTKNNNH